MNSINQFAQDGVGAIAEQSQQNQGWQALRRLTQFGLLSSSLGLCFSFMGVAAKPVLAADYLSYGGSTIAVSELDELAKTGQESLTIRAFRMTQLDETPQQIQEQLNRPISIDPTDTLDDLSEDEKRWLDDFVDNVSNEQLQTALKRADAQVEGEITMIDFIKAFPQETVAVENAIDFLFKSPVMQPEPTQQKQHGSKNILYLNSTRGRGTGSLGAYRSSIANGLDDYQDGNIFNVDFVQTHVGGNLASFLNSNPLDYYNQIWFDTTVYGAQILNQDDLDALNRWSSNSQPEFILDSSFFFRNRTSSTMTASATAATVNQALALRNAGGGIFIGTDGSPFAYTANQILNNFGFDGLFAGNPIITANGSFIGNLTLLPESVGPDFFTHHLSGLSTTAVPVGTHVLNENGGNRTIEIHEHLYSISSGHISHIGASFSTGDRESDISNPQPVPEPSTVTGLMVFGVVGLLTRKR